MSDPNSFDFIELQFAADDVSTAVGAASLIADAELREHDAATRAKDSETDLERLAAYLDERKAILDQIAAKAISSRVNWELGQILDSDS